MIVLACIETNGINMNSTNSLVVCICCVGFLIGCNTDRSQNASKFTLNEVIFLIPANVSVTKSVELKHGAVFEFEGLWGDLKDHRLAVMGEDYGEVNAGDEVQFESDGTVMVNGSRRKSAGVSKSAVENSGVLFFFPGRDVTKSSNESGTPIVEISDGSTYELTNGGIIIEGHEFGPFSSGTVVKIDLDGSVAFNP